MNQAPLATRNRAETTMVGPSLFVRLVMGPMTKVFNPVVRHLAGWREDLRDQFRGPLNPLERLTFRLLRIRQFLVLGMIHEALAVA